MNLPALRQKRAAKIAELDAINTRAANENRSELTSTETAEWAAGEAEVRALDDQIRRAETLADFERRTEAAEPLRSGERRELADIERRFQIGRAISAVAEARALSGPEAEWAAEHRSGRAGAIAMPVSVFLGERRAQTVSPATAGGHLVSTELGPFIDRLRPRLAIETLGATILSGLTGNLDLPRLTASGSAGWVAENGAATRSSAAFDKVSLAPKTVTAEYEMSRRLLLQATSVEAILRQDIGFLLAQALDGAAIQGGGSNEPTGILATTGVPQLAYFAPAQRAFTMHLVPDILGLFDAGNAAGPTGFLTNNKVKKQALVLLDATGRPYTLQEVFRDEPVQFSNQVPSDLTAGGDTDLSAILYGVWSDLIVGYWSSVDIVLNPYHSDVASKGGALLHAFLDADIALRHADSFVTCQDVGAP